MPFLIVRNDISKVKVDAIVNTANTKMQQGRGTSRAIYLAAGENELTEACEKIGKCELGQAVITRAFSLPAQYIIHTVGPSWKDGQSGEDKFLYSAYMESMKLALENGCESIAFPLISSGHYGYPKDLALKVAVSAISDFLLKNEMLVYLVLYDRKSVVISKKLFVSINEYIDDHYVNENDESYSRENEERYSNYDIDLNEEINTMQSMPDLSLDDVMHSMDETFSEMLLRIIDEKGLKDSEVYKKANIDRKLFSKIRNDKDYSPSKKTVLAFAISLELSLDETKDLLLRAGLALSNSNKFDVIMQYFIEKKSFNIFEINEALFSYGQQTLG